MRMIKAVIRPEKLYEVMRALEKEGFKGITVMDGKRRAKRDGMPERIIPASAIFLPSTDW